MGNGTQMTLGQLDPKKSQEPIVGASDSLAKTSALQGKQSDSMEVAAACFSKLCDLCKTKQKRIDPITYSLRMLKTFLVSIEGLTLPNFSLSWPGGGTMQNGKFSTVKILEYPKIEKDVILLDILEDEDKIDDKYYLSEHAVERLLYNDKEKVEAKMRRRCIKAGLKGEVDVK